MLKKTFSLVFGFSIAIFIVSVALAWSWAFWWLVGALFLGGPREIFNSSLTGTDHFIYFVFFITLMVLPMALLSWCNDTLYGEENEDEEQP